MHETAFLYESYVKVKVKVKVKAGKDKEIHVKPITGPEGSKRLQDFKTIDT